MVVYMKHGDELKKMDDVAIKEWLRAGGVDEAEVDSPANAEAYQDLTGLEIPYSYGADEQEMFVSALRMYARAAAESDEYREEFDEVFGAGDGVSQELNLWKPKLSEEEFVLYESVQQKILRNGDAVFTGMRRLNALIAADHAGPSPEDWHKRLLRELESEGFDQDPQRITTAQTKKDFLDQIEKGQLALDPGADERFFRTNPKNRENLKVKHGAFSHTIQWMIVKWSPERQLLGGRKLVEVFKRTANVRDERANLHHSLWTTLADLPAQRGIRFDATMPEGITYLGYAYFPYIRRLESEIEEEFRKETLGSVDTYPFEFRKLPWS